MNDTSLDLIHIRDLQLRCIIGIYDDERREKQDVNINVTLWADLREACRSDDIDDTVDYKAIKKKIVAMVEQSKYYLIEKLAEQIAVIALDDPKVAKARVLVEKPGALRFARTVGIEIERSRANE